MELKKINLLKDRYCLIPLTGVPWRSQIYRDRKQMVGARGGGGDGDSEFHRHRVSVWEGEKVLEMDGGDGCTIM